MYLVWINPPINFTFSDDSVFLKKNLGGGHKFSEFAYFFCCIEVTGKDSEEEVYNKVALQSVQICS